MYPRVEWLGVRWEGTKFGGVKSGTTIGPISTDFYAPRAAVGVGDGTGDDMELEDLYSMVADWWLNGDMRE
jgi:hypothetical protein